MTELDWWNSIKAQDIYHLMQKHLNTRTAGSKKTHAAQTVDWLGRSLWNMTRKSLTLEGKVKKFLLYSTLAFQNIKMVNQQKKSQESGNKANKAYVGNFCAFGLKFRIPWIPHVAVHAIWCGQIACNDNIVCDYLALTCVLYGIFHKQKYIFENYFI